MSAEDIDKEERKRMTQKTRGLVNGPYGVWVLENLRPELTQLSVKSLDIESSKSRMIEAFNSASHFNYSLGYGLTGLLWTINCMQHASEECNDIFDPEAIIPLLEAECIRLIEAMNYDLFNGAHGIMMYLMQIDKFSTVVTSRYITSLNKNLAKGELIPTNTSKVKDNKKLKGINLGVPHGVAGCVLTLATMCVYKPLPECKEVLKKAIVYLLSKSKCSTEASGCFTYSDHPESVIAPLAWCYGDLSTGYAILKAGKVLQHNKFLNIGSSILDGTLRRNDFAKKDLSLCHGAPCIAYVYYKAWLLTGNDRYRNRSMYWVDIIIQVINKYKKHRDPEQHSMNVFSKNPSLIYGFSGMHLALNTIRGKVSSKWDSWMLL